jgi:hypothetical protein
MAQRRRFAAALYRMMAQRRRFAAELYRMTEQWPLTQGAADR